ncbi:MAG: FliH/SctL family protein, partial [Pseudomonadota bacterium]
AHREVRVELHPEDATLVRDRLQDRQQGTKRWSIVEDPLIARGGCRVKGDDSLIDATLEARVGALVSRVFGEQRQEEQAARDDDGATAPAASA